MSGSVSIVSMCVCTRERDRAGRVHRFETNSLVLVLSSTSASANCATPPDSSPSPTFSPSVPFPVTSSLSTGLTGLLLLLLLPLAGRASRITGSCAYDRPSAPMKHGPVSPSSAVLCGHGLKSSSGDVPKLYLEQTRTGQDVSASLQARESRHVTSRRLADGRGRVSTWREGPGTQWRNLHPLCPRAAGCTSSSH